MIRLHFIVLAPLLPLLVWPVSVLAQGIPVYDEARERDFLEEFARMAEQLKTAQDQLESARQLYESMSGSRGMGSLARTITPGQYLPQTPADSSAVSGRVDELLASEAALAGSGTVDDAGAALSARQARLAPTSQALSERAYSGTQARLQQLETLLDQIDSTTDQKAIAELHARISGEQAALQAELNSLQLVAQQRQAEKQMIEDQERALNARILNPRNTGMPQIR